VLIAAGLVPLAPAAAPGGPAVLVEAQSGRVLHAHEPFRPWYPASLTKLMTLYVAFAAMESGRVAPESPVRISERAAASPFNNTGWRVGTEIALEEAVPLLVVKSANDLAVAVAETVSGDVESFVAELNATAESLGMTGTRFANPNGIHAADQTTTARDMALLATALIGDFPERRQRFAAESVMLNGQPVTSPNRLLGRFAGADGMKTGYLCASGWNIVASASRDGRTLVAVVLGALREGEREEVAAALLEAGFSAIGEGAQAAPTLGDLVPPADPAAPVDMRPYACEGRAPPHALTSFGLEGGPQLPRPKP
jgi:D-alanyl-D-alanine carboxypeptidase